MPTTSEILSFDEPAVPPGASPWVVRPAAVAIEVMAADSSWPQHARSVCDRIVRVLGPRALRIEHVGSTAVPGLDAKPVLDLDLTVADSSAEER